MSFTGFPERALIFYEGLEADNSRPYWLDHKPVYDDCVKAPMEALLADLEQEFGSSKFFRPYRDVRFAKDKTPYKTHAGAIVRQDRGAILYVELSAAGLTVAGGLYHPASQQVRRMRTAMADDHLGPVLEAELTSLRRGGWEIGGNPVKTRPPGTPADHPRLELLRFRQVTARKFLGDGDWLTERAALTKVRRSWRRLAALNDWIATHVGADPTAG